MKYVVVVVMINGVVIDVVVLVSLLAVIVGDVVLFIFCRCLNQFLPSHLIIIYIYK